ncbi:MAG: hypothetical protein ACFFCD_00950 [Promethearchaeota archaeon]
MRLTKRKDAVSPIVATILLTAIMVGAITVLYSVGAPLVTDFQDRSTIENVANDFYVADSNIRAVVNDGVGGTRVTQFTLDRGSLHFDEGTNASLEIRGDTSNDYLMIGTVGRLRYRLRSSMSDLSIQGSRAFTGAINQFVYTNDTAKNSEIAIINYTRPSFGIYHVYLEYRPRLYIDDNTQTLYLYTIRLIDEDNSFPHVGAPRITSNFVNLTIIERNDINVGPNWAIYEGGTQITNVRSYSSSSLTVKVLYYYIEI